ncbi:hypothetical protein ACFPTY_05680 [Halomonas beimenensis]|uniref:Uncharacterized protein n=1 Tax=Halomonas beimenensis TaxID=475662 RepID=A0A291P6F7_9GAMM|nr:hypothetical protein [Halomonas beimenensis]ATJ82465.1 hypothetical protein BEI_1478 [Halomonas beimenensis]
MPTQDQILSGLAMIANRWTMLAIAWHGYFALLLLGLWFRRFPDRRAMALSLTLPLLSVSALAWWQGNPFNGAVFLVGAGALAACGMRSSASCIRLGPPWARFLGLGVVLFGWVYPHFLDTASPLAYLYAAPLGLVPCPTLSAVIGVTLVANGLDSRPWVGLLGGMGLFYGLFGAVYLGVALDWVLLASALLLLGSLFAADSPRHRHR